MTGIDDLDAFELRVELDDAYEHALKALEKMAAAVAAGDLFTAATVVMVAKPWLHRVDLLKRALRLEAAA